MSDSKTVATAAPATSVTTAVDPSELTAAALAQFAAEFEASPKNRLAMNAATRVEPVDVAVNRARWVDASTHAFSVKVENEMKATNQKSSGRCWLFAALNGLRLPFAAAYGLDQFEFSQNYLFFWDKFERCNYFLEAIIATRAEPVDSRVVAHLLAAPLIDGGQYDMFVAVVQKYGLCPKSAYPESVASGNSAHLNFLVKNLLRSAAMRIRKLHAAGGKDGGVDAMRKTIIKPTLAAVYRVLCIQLGTPPTKFDWCYRAKPKKDSKTATGDSKTESSAPADTTTTAAAKPAADGKSSDDSGSDKEKSTKAKTKGDKAKDKEKDSKKAEKVFVRERDLTPQQFYQKLVLPALTANGGGGGVADGISLVHDPRNAYYRVYTVAHLGNVCGSPHTVAYLNVPIDVLKAHALARLRVGVPVWFGSDVGKYFHRTAQIMDTGMFDYALLYDTDQINAPDFDKAQRLIHGESLMTHAMLFTGVDVVPTTDATSAAAAAPAATASAGSTTTSGNSGGERIAKWRVENSWGDKNGDKGYATMSDEWFSEYVYQIVVDKAALSAEALAAWSTHRATPIVLPAWDPMGALATN